MTWRHSAFGLAGAAAVSGGARHIVGSIGGAPPLPPMVASSRGLPFHGREAALSALAGAWDRVRRGPSRLVLVTGEPGMGKSRLVVEFARRQHGDGVAILAGTCSPEPIGAYQPIREAMRDYVRGVGPDVVAAAFPERIPFLARLVPEVGPPGPPLSGNPELYRLALFEAVGAVLAAAGRHLPAVLILDDVHWADRSTVALLRHLLRTLPAQRLLVAATARLHEIDPQHPLAEVTAALRSGDLVDRIDLVGLDGAGVRAVIEARAGHELDPPLVRLADELHRITDGNPLFLTQLLRHLREIGRIGEEDGRWRVHGDPGALRVPEQVREVVRRRLSALSPDCQALLRSAAVLGLEFDLGPLAEVAGVDANRSLDLLEEAMRWRVVGEVAASVDRFVFLHALLRQSVYDDMSATRRQRLHQRAASASAAAGGDPTDVANHLLAAAAAVPTAEVCAGVLTAGREAISRTAYESAVSMCSRALHTLGHRIADGDRLALVALRAEANLFLGAVDDARDDVVAAAELASRVGDRERMAEVLTAWCRAAPVMAPDRQLLALCEEALAGLSPADSVVRARLMAAVCHQLVFAEPLPAIERRALEAYADARRLGDVEAIGHAATAYRLVADHRPLAQRRHDILDAIAEVAGTAGTRPGRLILLQHGLIHAFELGDRAAFDAARHEYETLADDLHYALGQGTAMRARAAVAVCEGRLAEAETLGADAFELTPYAIVSYSSLLFVLYRELGRLGEVAPAVPTFLAQFPDAIAWRVVALGLDHEMGRHDEVLAALRRLADDGFAAIDGAVAMRAIVAVLSELAAWTDDAAIVAPLYDRLVGWAGQNLSIEEYICLGASDRYLGQLETVLGDLDGAVHRLESAIEFDERFGSRLWADYDRLALARALERKAGAGDGDRATRLLERAAATAAEVGSVRLARLVANER